MRFTQSYFKRSQNILSLILIIFGSRSIDFEGEDRYY